jgi:hypothetical protein
VKKVANLFLLFIILISLIFGSFDISQAKGKDRHSSRSSYSHKSYSPRKYTSHSYKTYSPKTHTSKTYKATSYKGHTAKSSSRETHSYRKHTPGSHKNNYATGVARGTKGRIKRSEKAKREFMKQTGYPHGRPGYVVDHIIPLKKGGADTPSNMQWQTKEAAKQKDKWE